MAPVARSIVSLSKNIDAANTALAPIDRAVQTFTHLGVLFFDLCTTLNFTIIFLL